MPPPQARISAEQPATIVSDAVHSIRSWAYFRSARTHAERFPAMYSAKIRMTEMI
jgi:hypothetical protein